MSLKELVHSGPEADTARIVLYGLGGIGKSTWASKAEKPIFLDIEGGLGGIDAESIPLNESDYMGFIDTLKLIYEEKHDYKTLVIDSIDWLERIIHRHVCKTKSVDNIAELEWGKGYVAALNFIEQIISKLDKIREAKKMDVILIAHAAILQVENPGEKSYNRWGIQLHYKSAAKLFQWSDACLFATWDVYTTQEAGKFGATRNLAHGGDRVLRSVDQPTHLAKNRLGLPDPLKMDYEEFSRHLNQFKKRERVHA